MYNFSCITFSSDFRDLTKFKDDPQKLLCLGFSLFFILIWLLLLGFSLSKCLGIMCECNYSTILQNKLQGKNHGQIARK